MAQVRHLRLSDPLDTTIRLKYTLKTHPGLTTSESIAKLMTTFGPTDTESIVLSLKAPKKAAGKPPKYGTALVPFKQIGDAFAAVCASGKPERGLEGIEIGWVGGKEPSILVWLKKMGKLGTPPPPTKNRGVGPEGVTAGLPQTQTTADASSFSSFPTSFVCLPYLTSVTLSLMSYVLARHPKTSIETGIRARRSGL